MSDIFCHVRSRSNWVRAESYRHFSLFCSCLSEREYRTKFIDKRGLEMRRKGCSTYGNLRTSSRWSTRAAKLRDEKGNFLGASSPDSFLPDRFALRHSSARLKGESACRLHLWETFCLDHYCPIPQPIIVSSKFKFENTRGRIFPAQDQRMQCLPSDIHWSRKWIFTHYAFKLH